MTETIDGAIAADLNGDGGVGWIEIRRPAKRNALDSAAIGTLTRLFEEAEHRRRLRAIVLRGSNGIFSAGADINEMRGLEQPQARAFITSLHLLVQAVRDAPQVVIAQVEGHCYGGALELVAGCDIRVAAEGALFGMPEIRVGMPSVIEAALLVPLIGLGHTADLVLTGDSIDADRAERIGLVSRVVPQHRLDAEVQTLARRVASFSGPALRIQKRLIGRWLDAPSMASAIDAGIDAYEEAFRSPNPREALSAFLEKREPRFADE